MLLDLEIINDTKGKNTLDDVMKYMYNTYYKQKKHDYAAVEFPDVSTYQIIDIATTPKDRLTYHAYDMDGAVKDEFAIEK